MSLPVLSSAGGYTVNISDPRTGYKSSIHDPLYPHEAGKEAESVRISPDGSLLVSGGRDGNIVLMTLMVPRLLPSFTGRGRITDYKQKQRKSRGSSTFIKDISYKEDDDEVAVEELDELDDILSSPLQREVEQNVARLKRLGRTAAKEMELLEHSTVKKTANAKSSRKKRVAGKSIDLPTMIAHLASDKTEMLGIEKAKEKEEEIEEETEEKENKEKNDKIKKQEFKEDEIEEEEEKEKEEIQAHSLPHPIVTISKGLISDSASELSGELGLRHKDSMMEDTSEETDAESQFLDGMSTHSSVQSSLQVLSPLDGHYSMLDHLDSSILLTAGAGKKSKKKQIIAESKIISKQFIVL